MSIHRRNRCEGVDGANNTVTTLVSGLNSPYAVAVDGAGNVYMTTSSRRDQRMDVANSNVITLVQD